MRRLNCGFPLVFVLRMRCTPAECQIPPGRFSVRGGGSPPSNGGGGKTQLHAVLCHCAAGHMNAVLRQQLAQPLVAEGMAGVLLPHQKQQPLLQPLPGRALASHGPVEEVPQGVGALAALEEFVPHGPGDRGGMEPQLGRQPGEAHGGQLGGLALEEGALGLQDGPGAPARIPVI